MVSPKGTLFIWITRASGDRNKEEYASPSAGRATIQTLLLRFCHGQQGSEAPPLAEARWNFDKVHSQRPYPSTSSRQLCSVLQIFAKVILMVGISGKVGYNSIISFSYFCSSLRESKRRCLCAKSLRYNGIAACPFHSLQGVFFILCCSDNWWRAVAVNKQLGSFNDEIQALSDLKASLRYKICAVQFACQKNLTGKRLVLSPHWSAWELRQGPKSDKTPYQMSSSWLWKA